MCLVRDVRVTGPRPAGGRSGIRGTSPGRQLWSQRGLQEEAHSLHSCEKWPLVSVPHGVCVGLQLAIASDKCS